jgi:hypothetical protein
MANLAIHYGLDDVYELALAKDESTGSGFREETADLLAG